MTTSCAATTARPGVRWSNSLRDVRHNGWPRKDLHSGSNSIGSRTKPCCFPGRRATVCGRCWLRRKHLATGRQPYAGRVRRGLARLWCYGGLRKLRPCPARPHVRVSYGNRGFCSPEAALEESIGGLSRGEVLLETLCNRLSSRYPKIPPRTSARGSGFTHPFSGWRV